ncbi:hypothetical protein [Paenibacillus naphthalenovorans]|uniref:hypothetical protein n=1 Tax=Paenibacillus naphthalenovorans TaxID=162209 RepID=UPI0010B5BDB9|nr:hypothetical protein [Paenibacillus naphthalenovorans]GCL70213.1 hypothetical protein PN4B1_01130 [Paenibacillus naphthalenovorans]
MTTLQQAHPPRHFSIQEILKVPGLDIYQQMVCVVLSTYVNMAASGIPSVEEIAAQGRMSTKEATTALQQLAEQKVLPHKVFRDIVGDFGDNRLSWAAKGLLLYLQDHPRATLQELMDISANDKEAIRQELENLRRYGYIDEENEALIADLKEAI